MPKELIYDGRLHCGECGCGCPVVERDQQAGTVTISDPNKPESGTFTMTTEEYNTLLSNAQPVS